MRHCFRVCCTTLLFGLSAQAAIFFDENGMVTNERTICGANDMLKMIDQDEAFKKMGTPIGIYQIVQGSGMVMCTGTLISKDLFLTARHCQGTCAAAKVTFGYLQRRQDTFPCKEIVEFGNSDLNQDYLILRLDGMPGVEWGWYDMSDRPLEAGTELMMIHHPGGTPMKVSRKDCTFRGESNGLIRHRCDTEGGSSGTGILAPDFETPENSRIVAVHTLGGCTPNNPNSSNSGPAIRYLSTVSPLIKSMVK